MATRKTVVAAAAEASVPRSRRASIDSIEGEYGSSGQASTYFTDVEERNKDIQFVNTGCPTLNAALGGGWPLGRVVNVVGDKSAGKTLLAIEATANFKRDYPNGYIRYREAEAAFDEKYAGALGMPIEAIDFKGRPLTTKEKEKPQNTVEAFYRDVLWVIDQHPDVPILYVLDSLDALSDEAEQGRAIDDGSFGGNKAKKMGELFRRLVERISASNMLLVVISQLRDKMNAMTFGEKQTRSGGRALDFYASQIVWLAEIGKIKKTIGGVARIVGVDVRARVKKNKVGLPFRECSYPIIFGYGIDDLTACCAWLCDDAKRPERLKDVGLSESGYKVSIPKLRDRGGQEVREMRTRLTAIVWEVWQDIERAFIPKAGKY